MLLRTMLAAFLIMVSAVTAAAAELLMFEAPGGVWCQRWHAEIGPGYPLSDEGLAAPLKRLDIRDPLPSGIKLDRPVTMTPTFILMSGGRERGRIVGYPGSEFFYPLLASMIESLRLPDVPAARQAMR